jgi:hypothetical protein
MPRRSVGLRRALSGREARGVPDLARVIVAAAALPIQHPDGVVGPRGVLGDNRMPASAMRAAHLMARSERRVHRIRIDREVRQPGSRDRLAIGGDVLLPRRPAVGPRQGPAGDQVSEHATVLEAFAAIDALSAQMVRTGAPGDMVELIVVDDRGAPVARPNAH